MQWSLEAAREGYGEHWEVAEWVGRKEEESDAQGLHEFFEKHVFLLSVRERAGGKKTQPEESDRQISRRVTSSMFYTHSLLHR